MKAVSDPSRLVQALGISWLLILITARSHEADIRGSIKMYGSNSFLEKNT